MPDKNAPASNSDQKSSTKTPAERTKTIMAGRADKVLHAFDTLGKCANPEAYALNKEIVDEIEKAIKTKFDNTMASFREAVKTGKSQVQSEPGFSLEGLVA